MASKRPGEPKESRQREALKRSEKKAAARQPKNFKDAETDEKVVEIGPDMTDSPIEGIDPPDRKSVERP